MQRVETWQVEFAIFLGWLLPTLLLFFQQLALLLLFLTQRRARKGSVEALRRIQRLVFGLEEALSLAGTAAILVHRFQMLLDKHVLLRIDKHYVGGFIGARQAENRVVKQILDHLYVIHVVDLHNERFFLTSHARLHRCCWLWWLLLLLDLAAGI